jgi:hypothetical protein
MFFLSDNKKLNEKNKHVAVCVCVHVLNLKLCTLGKQNLKLKLHKNFIYILNL